MPSLQKIQKARIDPKHLRLELHGLPLLASSHVSFMPFPPLILNVKRNEKEKTS